MCASFCLPDGRVVVVLVSTGGNTRDKIIRPERVFTQPDLDRTADYLNRHYVGRTLEAIRADLLAPAGERAGTLRSAGARRAGAVRSRNAGAGLDAARLHRGRGADGRDTVNFPIRRSCAKCWWRSRKSTGSSPCWRAASIRRTRCTCRSACRESIPAGEHLALISAPYSYQDQSQGTVGVLGPMRMHYERAITAVAFVARAFSETLDRS